MKQRIVFLLSLALLAVTPCRIYAQAEDSSNQIFRSVSQSLKKKSFIGNTLFNDTFSGELFQMYLTSLDKQHIIFLQTDIDYLKKYALTLDDELNGSPPVFYLAVLQLYKTRIDEFEKKCHDILKQPFNLVSNEAIDLQEIARTYPANSTAQSSKLEQYLKYEVLKTMMVLPQSTNAAKSDIANIQKQAIAMVSEKYVNICAKIKKGLSVNDFLSDYLKQVCLTVDPHTNYQTPRDVIDMNAKATGTICGVGMQLDEDNGYFKVASLTKDGTAILSGKIKNGDLLVAVQEPGKEAENVTGWNLWEVIQHITGEEDSDVILFFRDQNAEKFSVTLKRKQIVNIASKVRGFIIKKENHKTGYIIIPQFNNQVAFDLQGQLITLMKEGAEGIVIDLRLNPGGRSDEVEMANGLFIPQGPTSQERYNKEDERAHVTVDRDPQMLYKGPLAILVSEHSASAAELFASCLQDYNRAIVIGLPTLGKGTTQVSFPVVIEGESAADIANNKYGQVTITIGMYYRITGPSVQLTGVIPDVNVPDYREMPQIRERERPYAMSADTVAPANYTYYNFGYDIPKAKRILDKQVKTSAQFAAIRKQAAWLQKQQTKPIPLSWEKLMAYKKEMTNGVNQAARISLLKNKLIVEVPAGNELGLADPGSGEDEEEMAKLNKRWQEYLSGDIQLNLAIDAIKLMQ